MDTVIFIVIIAACLVFIGACIVKKAGHDGGFPAWAFVGTAGIYLLDFVLTSCGYQVAVGINALQS